MLNLEEDLLHTLRVLAALSHLAPGPDTADVATIMSEYAAILAELSALGRAVPATDSEAAAGYVKFRRATDRYVAAYGEKLAYRRPTLRGTYYLFTRDSAAVRPPKNLSRTF